MSFNMRAEPLSSLSPPRFYHFALSTRLPFSMPALNLTNVTASASNATVKGLQVVCAWPLSGQYGPGSRILYYILVAACVFARKAEWLRNACLAAALLLPAVAALHGIVLAALHIDEAVDMDVFGAFQLCAIGILAAPVTVRLSTTYFNAKGRNIIFLWTILILSGLLSLTVEFLRIKTTACAHDDDGNPFSSNPAKFPYSTTFCGLVCDVDKGPFSPMRRGAQDNIYVIPAPDRLTFGTATLLSAGCCIPAILYLIFMWNKILEINWKTRWGSRDQEDGSDEPIEGTNGATIGKMKGINSMISMFLSAVEIPVFGAAVLTILIIGERNLFSDQMSYQTEPLKSVGQWAPIVGSGLAVMGSLYILLAADIAAEEEEEEKHHGSLNDSTCSVRHFERTSPDALSIRAPSAIEMRLSNEIVPTTTHRSTGLADAGGRRKFAKALTRIGNYVGTASQKRFDDSEFKQGKAVDFPEIPGEQHRNSALPQIRTQFNPDRDEEGRATPLFRPRSRAGSFNSRLDVDDLSEIRASSPRRKATLEVPGSHNRTNSSPAVVITSDDDVETPTSPPPVFFPHSP